MTVSDVTARLAMLGYTATQADTAEIEYLITKVDTYIKTFCNIPEVPEALNTYATDRVCGEFLKEKGYTAGTSVGVDASGAVKRITEGDTTIEYADGSGKSAKLDSLIADMLDDSILLRFRCIKW